MAHATLVVNPAAGARRTPQLYAVLEQLLVERGYRVTCCESTAEPGSLRQLAARAVERHETGDLVIACGGDGTAHAVVQALAATAVPLGILPGGTHNALARALGLPRDPVQALARLLTWQPRLLPLGQVCKDPDAKPDSFLLMAGLGPAGALAHQLAGPSRWKRSLGRGAYSLYAARLLLTRRWPAFRVDYRLHGSSTWQTTEAVSLLVSRVPSLGGLFTGLTPQAALHHLHLHAHVLRAPAPLALPAWLARCPNPWLQTLDADEIRCMPLDGTAPALVQADAEPLGTLPCTLSVRPAALYLLMPPVSTLSNSFPATP